MNVQIVFRGLDATDSLKGHIEKRAEKFTKFITYPMDVHVIIGQEGRLHSAEFTLHAEHQQFTALAETSDLYAAIDGAAHKIEAQLKKERERKKGQNARHVTNRKAGELGTDVEADYPHIEKLATKKSVG